MIWQNDMDHPGESDIHSFIIKYWLEENAIGSGKALWRGQVTHIPGGERRGFQDDTTLLDFIHAYLLAPPGSSDAE